MLIGAYAQQSDTERTQMSLRGKDEPWPTAQEGKEPAAGAHCPVHAPRTTLRERLARGLDLWQTPARTLVHLKRVPPLNKIIIFFSVLFQGDVSSTDSAFSSSLYFKMIYKMDIICSL